MVTRTRRPRRVYQTGEEPDPRFTLANERTLLAWLRTSLALVVAGVAIVALADLVEQVWLAQVTAAVAFVGGGAAAVLGYRHWQRVERALRLSQPLPATSGSLLVLVTILVIAVVGAIGLLVAIV